MTSHGCLQMEKTKKESICVMRNITVSYVLHIYIPQKGGRRAQENMEITAYDVVNSMEFYLFILKTTAM